MHYNFSVLGTLSLEIEYYIGPSVPTLQFNGLLQRDFNITKSAGNQDSFLILRTLLYSKFCYTKFVMLRNFVMFRYIMV